MSNIDEDIENVKDFLNGKKLMYGEKGYKNNNNLKSIENILSEFQGVRNIATSTLIDNANLQSELETYKKIAEKLADKILEMDIDGEVYDFFCKYIPMEKCDEFSDGYCDKCIIDWARKEVEKDV